MIVSGRRGLGKKMEHPWEGICQGQREREVLKTEAGSKWLDLRGNSMAATWRRWLFTVAATGKRGLNRKGWQRLGGVIYRVKLGVIYGSDGSEINKRFSKIQYVLFF